MIEAYGGKWKTDDPIVIELKLYSADDEFRSQFSGALSRAAHLTKAIKLLLPDKGDGKGLIWHSWMDQAIDAWCRRSIMSWWGPSSAGKSSIAGLLLYVDLLANPEGTYTVLVTDTLKNHEKRCWSQVIKWRSLMPKKWQLGKKYDSTQAKRLVISEGGTVAGIFCTFMDRGAKAEELKDKLGGHNLRNRLCVDEAQSCGKVALSIKLNLGAGGEGWMAYRELFIGNPDDWSNTLGYHSAPKELNREDTTAQDAVEWETTQVWNDVHGICMAFDARNSPARVSEAEAKRLHFLPSVASLENLANQEGGVDSQGYWTYAIGRIPPAGGRPSLLSEADANAVGASKARPWADNQRRERFVGIDTSLGGDNVPLVLLELGESRDGLASYANGTAGGQRRALAQVVDLKSAMPDKSKPDKSGQIAAKIVDVVNEWGVDWANVAIESGGQQGHVIDTIERIAGCHGRIKRINPAGPATTRIVGRGVAVGKDVHAPKKQETARDRIHTRAAEIALNAAALVAQGSVCRVPVVILEQMMSRGVFQVDGRTDIQPKEKWSKENGDKSPDEMDALGVILDDLLTRGKLRLGEPKMAAQAVETMPYGFMEPKRKIGGVGAYLAKRREAMR